MVDRNPGSFLADGSPNLKDEAMKKRKEAEDKAEKPAEPAKKKRGGIADADDAKKL